MIILHNVIFDNMKTDKQIEEEINRILSNIKEIRLSKNIGQEWISEKLGISQAAYSNWEKGIRDLSYKNLLKIADVLECNVMDIIIYPNYSETHISKSEKVCVTFEVDPQKRDYLLQLVMGEKIKD